jgi:excisionase family DNA binding protein
MPPDPPAPQLSTAEAAAALGVSISTVKRWVDEGLLKAHRTAGGHRKLLRADVLAFARAAQLPEAAVADLELAPATREPRQASAALYRSLVSGDGERVRGLIFGLHAGGMRLETLADDVIAPAMRRLGHEWETDQIDVWREHRGTELCVAALHALRSELPSSASRRPLALGAAPEGDFYQLPTLLAQLVLMESGWTAVNLGPNTPFAGLERALVELRPRLIWLSVSYLADVARFVREYRTFYETVARTGTAVALGGQALGAIRAEIPYTTFGDGLSQLAAFARQLAPPPAPPRRGRPPGDGR